MKARLFTLLISIFCSTLFAPHASGMKRQFGGGSDQTAKRQKLSHNESHDENTKLLEQIKEEPVTPEITGTVSTDDAAKTEKRDYSINVMWINKILDERRLYICPAENKDEAYKNLLNTVLGWASLNPESIVNIWFDSQMTTEEAVRKTSQLIEEMKVKNPNIAPVVLRDIRELPDVYNNADIFSHPEIPVYFRADLVRVIAALALLSEKVTNSYFVYADLDVKPLSQGDLFDDITQENLGKVGFVMAHDVSLGFENLFQIISNHKENLLHAMKQLIIELNIERAKYAVSKNTERAFNKLQQIVYDSYKHMFKYFLHLDGYGELSFIELDDTKIPYDINIHGLTPFGLDQAHDMDISFEYTSRDRSYASQENCRWVVLPTKEVAVTRPVSLNYC